MDKVSKLLRDLVGGLSPGSGVSSLLSRTAVIGARPDRIRGALYITAANGSKLFLERQGIIYALSADDTGERILTSSWALPLETLRHFLNTASPDNGAPAEITLDVLIHDDRQASTLRSTSSKPRTFGISGVPCDGCGKPFEKADAYRADTEPGHHLGLYCIACAEKRRTFG